MIVNSWNEWAPLKHVIVGRADNCCIPPAEPATDPKIPEDSDMKGTHGPRTQESIDKGNAQLDGLASILKKRGYNIFWSKDLKVYEKTHEHRTNLKWMIKQIY